MNKPNMECPYIDAEFELFGGKLRLHSASGPLEAMWIQLLSPEDQLVLTLKDGMKVQPAVRITPKQAKQIGKAFLVYAKHHKETK